jgi:hypothetical protein
MVESIEDMREKDWATRDSHVVETAITDENGYASRRFQTLEISIAKELKEYNVVAWRQIPVTY